MNERYQKQNAHAGSTKKSASSAKPKREAGSSSPTTTKKKAPEKKKQSWSEMVPSTPEIKKWRRIWYVLLAVALVAFGLAYYGQNIHNTLMSSIGFMVELISVGIAIAIDLVVIRRLRNEAIKERAAGKKGKSASKSSDKSGSKNDNDTVASDAGKDPS